MGAASFFLGGETDGGENADVAAAAAEVAVEGVDDLGVGGVGRGFKKCDGTEDHAGDAVAALHGFGIEEGLLNAMQAFASGEAFDGGDGFACGEAGGGEAGGDGLAVEEDSAGAALPFAAAVLGSGEAEIFAEDVEEGSVGVGGKLMGLAVDGDRHMTVSVLVWGVVLKNALLRVIGRAFQLDAVFVGIGEADKRRGLGGLGGRLS
jgi:hypothetical protein